MSRHTPTSTTPDTDVDNDTDVDTDTDAASDVVLTPLGARGGLTRIGRTERSRRTHHLLGLAAETTDPDERAGLLDEVVVLNCRVADAVAARYRDRGVPLEDLQQAAYEGLVKAVGRFDAEHADDLLTFAVPTIRGEVQRYFRDRSWMVRPPRRVQELQHHVAETTARLRDELGREPTGPEVYEGVGIGRAEYTEVVAALGCFTPTSLDRPLGDGSGSATMGDLIADGRESESAAEARVLVAPAMRGLGERDRRLVFLRFYEECSQREIGLELGLTQTQVSRLLERVLRDLKRAVGADGFETAAACSA